MWGKNSLGIIFLCLLVICSCNNREQIVDQRLLSNNDYRLFQGTPVWNLAKAVEDEDEESIINILKTNPYLVNYQSPKYGVTVLHLAVSHHSVKSVNCLLNLNADVNLRDKEDGDTPLNKACFASYAGDDGIKILKMLIAHGANINVLEVPDSSKMPDSPLMSACFDGFEDAVALLIASGADVNYIKNNEENALGESLTAHHFKIAYYLLLHGADYSYPIFHIKGNRKDNYGKIIRSVYIKEVLENTRIDYFTPEREYYYKIVDYLNKKGLKIKEYGKRNFDLQTMIKEIKELRE